MSMIIAQAKPVRCVTRHAGRYAAERRPFQSGKGPTLWGEWRGFPGEQLYVVYSYGEHFPIYLWSEQRREWFGNRDGYSPTTSRHQSQANPRSASMTWMDQEWMRRAAALGITNQVRELMVAAARKAA